VIPNYYFAGWTFVDNGGSISGATRNYRNREIALKGGAFLKGEVILYANYKRIELTTDSAEVYTYLQEEGTYAGVRQGPEIKGNFVDLTPANGSFDCLAGIYQNGTLTPKGKDFYTGTTRSGASYKSEFAPYDAGDGYEYIVCVYQKNDTGNVSNGLLGYIRKVFRINPVSIANKDLARYYPDSSGNTDWAYSTGLPSRPYTGSAYQPVPEYVKLRANVNLFGDIGITSKEYRLEYGKDYVVASYNNNVTVGKAVLSIKAAGSNNFESECREAVSFEITPISIEGLQVEASMAAEIQQKYKLEYTGKEQRPDAVLLKILVPQYDNGVTADSVGNVPQPDGTFKTVIVYRRDANNNIYKVDSYYPLDKPAVGTLHTTYFIETDEAGTKYSDNINTCTHEESDEHNKKCTCAYFIVSNFTGNIISTVKDEYGDDRELELKVYFDIAQLDLNGKDFTVKAQNFNKNITTYTGTNITPIPDSVSIVVSGLTHWVRQGNGYVSLAVPLTFNVYRDGYTPELISDYCGVFVNEFTYNNNINVKYDGTQVIAGANINISFLSGNIIASNSTVVSTAFAIYPRDITDSFRGAPVVYITDKKGNKTLANQTYNGAAIEPTIDVYGSPNIEYTSNVNSSYKKLIEGKEYVVSYANNVDVSNEAQIIVTGVGNYCGSFEGDNAFKFTIVAYDISKADSVSITGIKDQVYTGAKLLPTDLGSMVKTKTIVRGGVASEYAVLTLTITDADHFAGGVYVFEIIESINFTFNTDLDRIGDNRNVNDLSKYIGVDLFGKAPSVGNVGAIIENTIYDDYGNAYPCNNLYGALSVDFKINAKEISQVALPEGDARQAAMATWEQYPDHVTYDGTRKAENLNIIAFGQPGVLETDNHTLIVRDSYIEQSTIYTLMLKYGTDYKLATKGTYGENVNAGQASIKIDGMGNYTGSLDLYFEILPRQIGQEPDFVSLKLNVDENEGRVQEEEVNGELKDVYYYYFTGNKITPTFQETLYYINASAPVSFDKDVAYELYYGVDGDYEFNYSATKGGKITLTGIGNFSGQLEYSFKIISKPQDKFDVTLQNPYESALNQGLIAVESIATKKAYDDGTYSFYADYELTETGLNGISLYAETDSLGVIVNGVPNAVGLRFIVRDHRGTDVSTGFTITYKNLVESDNNLTADGKSYCFATLVPASNYSGIVHISVAFNDVNYEAKESAEVYRVYVKMVDKSESDVLNSAQTIEKVYGNSNFVFDAKLLSYNSYRFEYLVSSSDDSVASIDWYSNFNSTRYTAITLGSVGEAEITISHNGYVNASAVDQAFIAFSKSFKVNVAPRELVISFEELTIEYGVNPIDQGLFVYTYTTNGNVEGTVDTNTGLVGGDVITDIVTGYKVAYNTTNHINSTVGDNGVSVPYVIGFDISAIEQHSNNYSISFVESKLHVVKKLLTLALFQKDNSVPNQIRKTYGTPNPTNYSVSMTDLAYSDLQSLIEKESGYEAPVVNYGTTVTLTSPSSQTYTVLLSGGKAKNYRFPELEITVIVEKAPVKISTTNFAVDYSGDNVDVAMLAPQITGVGNGCAEPIDANDASKLTYRFRTGSSWTTSVPARAGTYDVEITFNALAEDNYSTTKVTKSAAITINKVAPLIKYEYYNTVSFTGKGIESTSYPAFVRAINDRAEVPLNVKIERYAFKHISDDANDPNYEYDVNGKVLAENGIPIGYDTTLPVKVGRYSVVVEYVAKEADNYKSVTVLFEGCLCIITGAVEAKLKTDQYVKAFDNKPLPITLEDFEYVYYKIDGIPCVLDNEPEIFFRSETGREVEWDKNVPLNAGTYSVMLVYTPSDREISGNLVARSEIRFPNCIVIDKFNLLSQDGHIYKNYTGAYDGGVYDANAHRLPDGSIVVKGREGNEDGPKGSLTISYVKDGIVYEAPVEAGTYDVVVGYVEGKGDNYCAIRESTNNTITFKSAISISKAIAQIDNNQSQVTYVYNGNGRAYGSVAIIGVQLSSGAYERPKGTLKYTYRLNGVTGAFSEVLPKNVGRYDVSVVYVPASNDNYRAGEAVVLEGVIVIEPAQPSIVITQKTYVFGEPVYYTQGAGYSVKGPQGDINGPYNETGVSGIGSQIVVQYGVRYTTADGSAGYDWSSEAPTMPGKYSVRVSFIAADGSNFLSHSDFATDCLVILNETPDLSLEPKTVYYNGKQQTANAASVSKYGIPYVKYYEGIEDVEHAYRGNLSYEYRKGSASWKGEAPTEVGVYDVKVTYNANTTKDVFAAYTQEFTGALVIEKLNVTVMPIYGLGHLYDGELMDVNDTAFIYSYQENGYTYIKYATIGDLDKNELIDLSSSTFTDENGNVYTIITNAALTSDAWLDYYSTELRYVSGSFATGSGVVVVNYSDLGVSSGKVEYAVGDKTYLLDLDLGIAYVENTIE
ncbi:MAG: hypothetical protein J6R35_00820, partial [Clostridia bacterium]|nr:hypothetical protein [Clostridia bacterium]